MAPLKEIKSNGKLGKSMYLYRAEDYAPPVHNVPLASLSS